jgi:glycosyltransferase involved in cell wall biosynthesis
MENPWKDIELTGDWLMKIKKEVQPDLVHLHTYSLGNLEWNVPVIMTFHSSVLSRWEAVHHELAPDNWNIYRKNTSKGIQAATFIIASNFSMLNDAEKYYGTFRNKRVIYNGRDRRLYKTSKKEKFVFSMGRIQDEALNINLILKAASAIKYPVFIAGDKSSVKEKGLPANVHFTGPLSQEEMIVWLSKAAVFALPALYDPFGYAFLEAAFSSCALIGGNIQSLKEIWGDSMIYADTRRADLLANMINKLMTDENRLESYGSKALQQAISKYTLQTMVHEYADLYHGLSEYGRKIKTVKSMRTL